MIHGTQTSASPNIYSVTIERRVRLEYSFPLATEFFDENLGLGINLMKNIIIHHVQFWPLKTKESD